MLRALLFDLDGTISDTDPLHLRAWQEFLAGRDFQVDEEFYRQRITGRTTPAVVRDIFPDLSDEDVAGYSDRKEAIFRRMAAEMKAVAGLCDVLDRAHERSWKCALVTNGSRENATFMLRIIGIDNRFDVLVFGEELRAGKPDPLPYRMALEQLHLEPTQALAFEDSIAGLRSATGAGLRTVGLATSQSADDLLAAGATLVIKDFRDRGLWELLG
jgi:HAD superfamily hydrolase (TIGR01509 family)